jgi:NADH-quinone oxidoreductase subunit N
LAGNLLALKQDNLKRILAYSSIAHIGYLFITLIVYGVLQQPGLAVEAAAFYLSAYIITSLAAFSLLSIISSNTSETDLDDISHIQGLFWRQPMLALMLTIALLSLAGIPLTVGFIGKFYIFTAGIEGSLWVLLAALIIGSGISIYYYLRIVFQMTMKEPAGGSGAANMDPNSVRLSVLSKFVVWLLIFMMLYLGVLPQTLMEYLGGLSL